MKRSIKLSYTILLILLLLGFSVSSYADLYEPVPQCYQPSQPLWFATSYYKERYDHDVDEYQACMKKFIQKQEIAAKKHTQAAQDAIKSWNDFVKEK